MEGNQKKAITLTLIGIAILLLTVIGSAFAYFSIVNNSQGQTSTNFTGKLQDTKDVGSALLKPGVEGLHIRIKASDMGTGKIGTSYYATVTEADHQENKGNHIVTTAEISGGDNQTSYSCTSTLKITAELKITEKGTLVEDNPLTNSDGYIYFGTKSETSGNRVSIAPTKVTLKDIVDAQESGGYTKQLQYIINGPTNVSLTTDIEIINTKDDQTALSGKEINITMTNSNLECSVLGPTAPGTKLEGEANLTRELVHGMYRYQGNSIVEFSDEMEMPNVTDTVDNNFICLGNDCGENGNDMYRIIGITQDNIIKVVKMKSIGESSWYDDYQTDTPWPQSNIYSKLNTNPDSFLSTLSSNLQEKIVDYEWKYGTVGFDEEKFNEVNDLMSGDDEVAAYQAMIDLYLETIETEEEKSNLTQPAKIGLMSVTDYCSSFESGGDKNCLSSAMVEATGDYNEIGISWLSPMNNDSEISWEWTMSYIGVNPGYSNYYAWIVNVYGNVYYDAVDAEDALRPSFYLSSDVELSGEGTIASPYKVTGIEE